MKTLLLATAMTTAIATGLPASAQQPQSGADGAPVAARAVGQATDGPRYQWQYHYVGRHAHLEGYWAPVK